MVIKHDRCFEKSKEGGSHKANVISGMTKMVLHTYNIAIKCTKAQDSHNVPLKICKLKRKRKQASQL